MNNKTKKILLTFLLVFSAGFVLTGCKNKTPINQEPIQDINETTKDENDIKEELKKELKEEIKAEIKEEMEQTDEEKSHFDLDVNDNKISMDFSASLNDIDISNIQTADGVSVEIKGAEKTQEYITNDIPLSEDKIPKGLLPIGTVVLLKDSTKKVVIIGHNQVDVNDRSVVYDYSANLFPEGYMSADQIYLFNHDQIEYVYHLGYQDNNQSPIIHNKTSKDLLPVGSVVLLENSTAKVMIIGICQLDETETIWDYSACLYPEGYYNADSNYLFNNSQIKQIYHLGYQNDEYKELNELAQSVIELYRSPNYQ